MSVAFRRDSDDERLEPRFELPIPPGPNLVTARGNALLVARVAELEAPLTDAHREDERKALLRDERYWRSRLTSAQIVQPPSGETVAIGTRLSVERDRQARTFEIVGHDESDPNNGRISFASPLARAVIAAEVGQLPTSPAPTIRPRSSQ